MTAEAEPETVQVSDFPFTPAVLEWLRSLAGEPMSSNGILWIPTYDVRWGLRRAAEPGWWEVVKQERALPIRAEMRGQPECAERFLVWCESPEATFDPHGHNLLTPYAPTTVVAPGGPLTVAAAPDGGARVIADGEPVAVFPDRAGRLLGPIEFTHYGYLPAELIHELNERPLDARPFVGRPPYDSPEGQQRLAADIREQVLALLADRAMPPEELRRRQLHAIPQSDLDALREVRRHLRYFSLVLPRPKEGEGSSLQVAFRVADAAEQKRLLADLRLAPRQDPGSLQRIRLEEESVEVTVETGAAWLAPDAGILHERLVLLRLWNPAAIYDVTPDLVAQASRLEARFDQLGLDAFERETGLLSFVTPERFPELFGEPVSDGPEA